MLNLFSLSKSYHSRVAIFFLIALSLLMMSGCARLFGVKQPIKIAQLLSPLENANTSQLIAEVNRLAAVHSLKAKLDIQIQDNSFAESGLAEKYKTADGTVYLQRPGQIYLRIQAPFVGTDVAEMTSDGEHFRVAVLQGEDKYKRFVRGTNNAVYPKLEVDDPAGDKKKKGVDGEQTVSALSNLRPQHFTDALMIRPIQPRAESGLIYAMSEFYQEEDDTRPHAKKTDRVVRGYYLLDELGSGGDTGAHLVRRFWFDRVGGIRLARVQTFDQDGLLDSDVSYFDPKNFGENGQLVMPARVELTRPHDRYKLSISYQSPAAVEMNNEYKPSIFVLENKWQLPELDLDQRAKRKSSEK